MAAWSESIHVTNENVTGSASVGSATTLFSIPVGGFDRISVQVTDAGTTCTISYEVSNDNSTWVAIGGYAPATPATETVTTTTTAVMTVFRCDARYFRARVSTWTSGTPAVTFHARSIVTSP
jgi:hypothetical protein